MRPSRLLLRGAPAPRPLVAEKTVATNRKARHDYEILEIVEAGLVLTGSEIDDVSTNLLTPGPSATNGTPAEADASVQSQASGEADKTDQ